eukprot:5832216-Pyramimonas_sp.AAC.1
MSVGGSGARSLWRGPSPAPPTCRTFRAGGPPSPASRAPPPPRSPAAPPTRQPLSTALRAPDAPKRRPEGGRKVVNLWSKGAKKWYHEGSTTEAHRTHTSHS